MADQINDVWGPLDIQNWSQTPCIKDRLATKKDVEAGMAVLHQQPHRNVAAEGEAACLRHSHGSGHEERDAGSHDPGREVSGQKLIGYRFLHGGNGIGLLSEFTVLSGPDKRFR